MGANGVLIAGKVKGYERCTRYSVERMSCRASDRESEKEERERGREREKVGE